MKRIWTLLLITAVILSFNSCLRDNPQITEEDEDYDGVMTAGSEMSSDLENMMNMDEFKIVTDLDSYQLPFEVSSHLKLNSYSLKNLVSEKKSNPSFDFIANCGTWEWDFDSLLFLKSNAYPTDSIKILFPSKGSKTNNRLFIWWKCIPLVLDNNNLPTELAMRFEWLNNSNKQLNFNWIASYETVLMNDSSYVFRNAYSLFDICRGQRSVSILFQSARSKRAV